MKVLHVCFTRWNSVLSQSRNGRLQGEKAFQNKPPRDHTQRPFTLSALRLDPATASLCHQVPQGQGFSSNLTISLSSHQLPVFAAVGGELTVVPDPLEFQRPAPFSQAGEHEAVPFQVDLGQARLRFEVGCNVIWDIKRQQREQGTLNDAEMKITQSDQ